MAAQAAEPAVDEVEYLWPCNVPTWRAWCDVQTQWRTGGMGGITGLDYAGVRAHLDEIGLQPGSEERAAVYSGIRAAEHATLEARADREASKT